jgi:hypothetical protein
MAVGYNPSIVSDGLVLYLDAVNLRSYSGSGNTWYDLTTNSNHAQKINSPNYINTSGGGFTFDGIGTNYFNLDSKSSLVNVNAGTVGGWVRFNDLDSDSTNYVFVSYGGNAYGGGFILQHSGLGGTSLRLELLTFGGSISGAPRANIDKSTAMPYQGQDIYMIGTWTTSEVKLYINGVLLSTVSTNAALPSRSTLRISSEGGRGRGVNGTVYNTSIYNRALTQQEILQNFNATRFRYGI